MDYYLAVFTETEDAVEVYIPDVKGCATFGKDWTEAYEMAVDALAGCLSGASRRPTKSSREKIGKEYEGKIIPVPVDEQILKSYEKSERFNVIFPESLLREVDEYRGKNKMKRSELLAEAAKEYISSH